MKTCNCYKVRVREQFCTFRICNIGKKLLLQPQTFNTLLITRKGSKTSLETTKEKVFQFFHIQGLPVGGSEWTYNRRTHILFCQRWIFTSLGTT